MIVVLEIINIAHYIVLKKFAFVLVCSSPSGAETRILQENIISIMAVDFGTPSILRSSATILLTK